MHDMPHRVMTVLDVLTKTLKFLDFVIRQFKGTSMNPSLEIFRGLTSRRNNFIQYRLPSAGSFTAEHICIQQFWEVVSHFSEEDKKKLLKFVTSCSRPPLLGFKVR